MWEWGWGWILLFFLFFLIVIIALAYFWAYPKWQSWRQSQFVVQPTPPSKTPQPSTDDVNQQKKPKTNRKEGIHESTLE